jgi:hypothetical protein
MNLAEVELIIASWAIDNNIKIFYGSIDNSECITVDWTNSDEYQDFLEIAKFKGVNLLILHTSKFDIEGEVDINDIEEIEDSELKEKLKIEYETLKKFNNHTDLLEISWISDSVLYQCVLTDDLSLKLDSLKDEIENIEGSEFDEISSVRRFGSSMPNKNKISNKESKEIALKLAAHPDYYIFRYDFDKLHALISEILIQSGGDDKLDHIDKHLLGRMADTYFKEKYLLIREKEMTKKVIELKQQGLSKIAVRGKLGMSESMINKFWYTT